MCHYNCFMLYSRQKPRHIWCHCGFVGMGQKTGRAVKTEKFSGIGVDCFVVGLIKPNFLTHLMLSHSIESCFCWFWPSNGDAINRFCLWVKTLEFPETKGKKDNELIDISRSTSHTPVPQYRGRFGNYVISMSHYVLCEFPFPDKVIANHFPFDIYTIQHRHTSFFFCYTFTKHHVVNGMI